VGGESDQGGKVARGMDIDWAEEVVGACAKHNVPCFFKQTGSRPVMNGLGLRIPRAGKKDRAHAAFPDWLPEFMRVQQFPVTPGTSGHTLAEVLAE
jgi:hypothetical protein